MIYNQYYWLLPGFSPMPRVHRSKKDLVGKCCNKKPILCKYCPKQLIWKLQRFSYTCFLSTRLQITWIVASQITWIVADNLNWLASQPVADNLNRGHHKRLEANVKAVGLLQSWRLISRLKSLVYVPNIKQNLRKDCVLSLQLPQGYHTPAIWDWRPIQVFWVPFNCF